MKISNCQYNSLMLVINVCAMTIGQNIYLLKNFCEALYLVSSLNMSTFEGLFRAVISNSNCMRGPNKRSESSCRAGNFFFLFYFIEMSNHLLNIIKTYTNSNKNNKGKKEVKFILIFCLKS